MAVAVVSPTKKKEDDSLGKALSVLQIANAGTDLAAKAKSGSASAAPEMDEPAPVPSPPANNAPTNQSAAMNRRYEQKQKMLYGGY